MNKIEVPLKLDSLDDDRVLFVGVEKMTIMRTTILGQEVEGEMQWPGVALPRSAWEELGCPTVLMLTLSLAEVKL